MHDACCLHKALMRMHDALGPGCRTRGVQNRCNLSGHNLRNTNGDNRGTKQTVKRTGSAAWPATCEITKLQRRNGWTCFCGFRIEIGLTYITRRPAVAKDVVNFRPLQLRIDGYDNSPRFQAA